MAWRAAVGRSAVKRALAAQAMARNPPAFKQSTQVEYAGVRNLRTNCSQHCRVVFKQFRISGVSRSSNFGTCTMALG
eukprot:14058467-Alexandrium_andersonii.AAC.1